MTFSVLVFQFKHDLILEQNHTNKLRTSRTKKNKIKANCIKRVGVITIHGLIEN